MSTVNIVLRMPPALHERTKQEAAKKSGLSLNSEIIQILSEWYGVTLDEQPTRSTPSTEENTARVLALLLPPESLSVKEVSQREGIPQMTIYGWRRKARAANTHPK